MSIQIKLPAKRNKFPTGVAMKKGVFAPWQTLLS